MNQNDTLWKPSKDLIESSSLYAFMQSLGFSTYKELHTWSCTETASFWQHVWNFCGVLGDQTGPVFNKTKAMFDTHFFEDSKLNIAENLLRQKGRHTAITFWNESGLKRDLSYDELYKQVSSVAQYLTDQGVGIGDRVAGYLPNIPETVIAMIATASIGAIWSCCSPDLGIQGVCDRLGQITPKILITVDGYTYAGKIHVVCDKISEIKKTIQSIEHVIRIPYLGITPVFDDYMCYKKILKTYPPKDIVFERFSFNHPFVILFSSGTTGAPKCIVHGAGGTLIQHMKEHQLHCNIKAGDAVFYYTTCGWMMWNWLVSTLASKARVVLFEGSPMHPSPDILMEMARDVGVSFFGTSAKYLNSLLKIDYKLSWDLPRLKTC